MIKKNLNELGCMIKLKLKLKTTYLFPLGHFNFYIVLATLILI